MTRPTPAQDALDRGDGWVDLSSWWKVSVTGGDAAAWLNDLLSGELSGIEPGESRRSLFLTPTGRVRASVNVTVLGEEHLLLQDPVQGTRIDELLDRYVLSSDVTLRERTAELRLLALPSRTAAWPGGGTAISPSVLGPGVDVLLDAAAPVDGVTGLAEISPEDVERWRIRHGVARVGIDLGPDSLPHEAELGDAIAYGKGCFLGQEAVARVRNLGHPPFVLLAADAGGPVASSEPIVSDAGEVGGVTSTATGADGTALIARVRWAARDAALRTASGLDLRVRGVASA